MSTQTIFITAGSTSKTVDLALVQNAGATSPGNPLTALAYNTASLTAYQRSGATTTATAITLATQTVGGAYSSGGLVEISSTNMPGLYRFDIPNALVSAVGETNITFNGAANLATHTLKIIVTAWDLFNINANFRSALTESYPTAGSAPTIEQCMNAHLQERRNFAYIGTTKLVYKYDGSTTAMTINLGGSPASSGAQA